jgi:hypothetical protein
MKAEELRTHFKGLGMLLTIKDSNELANLVDASFKQKLAAAPTLLEYHPGSFWIPEADADSILGKPIRRGKLIFIEDVPQKVELPELINCLETGNEAAKDLARRIKMAGISV